MVGGINRVRAAPTSTPVSELEPCLDPYPVAAWSEVGDVKIFDVRPLLNSLDRPGTSYDARKVNTPMFTVKAHNGVEGYAMDWAGVVNGGAGGGGKASSLRLLTGDIHSKIFLTTAGNAGFTTNPTPFTSHTSSVEDLQWSPKEPTVFASCSADRSVRVWDVRVKNRRSVISVEGAHAQDVNVISWNRGTDYLLVSGGDEGALKVWDLRHFKPNSTPSPVAHFEWHKAPISSVEWHPPKTRSLRRQVATTKSHSGISPSNRTTTRRSRTVCATCRPNCSSATTASPTARNSTGTRRSPVPLPPPPSTASTSSRPSRSNLSLRRFCPVRYSLMHFSSCICTIHPLLAACRFSKSMRGNFF